MAYFALSCGARAISSIKDSYPDKEVLADFKIMDAGSYEAGIAFEAGADIVTVLGVSSDATIAGAVSAARKFQREVMVDLIGIVGAGITAEPDREKSSRRYQKKTTRGGE